MFGSNPTSWVRRMLALGVGQSGRTAGLGETSECYDWPDPRGRINFLHWATRNILARVVHDRVRIP